MSTQQQVSTRDDAPSTLATLVDAVNAPDRQDRPFSDDDLIMITEKGLAALATAAERNPR